MSQILLGFDLLLSTSLIALAVAALTSREPRRAVILFVAFGLLLFLLLAGVPVAFSILISGVAGIREAREGELTLLADPSLDFLAGTGLVPDQVSGQLAQRLVGQAKKQRRAAQDHDRQVGRDTLQR